MEPFGAFRLLTQPNAVTQALVLFQMVINIIFLYLVMHEKHQLTQVRACNTVIAA